MNIIVCIDDNKGMLFNARRQSKDNAVVEKIKEITKDNTLWIDEFSVDLLPFADRVHFDMLKMAKDEEYCFVENKSPSPSMDKIQRIYLFKWNRKYPSDFKFEIEVEKYFRLANKEEFAGSSHDKITLEVWENDVLQKTRK